MQTAEVIATIRWIRLVLDDQFSDMLFQGALGGRVPGHILLQVAYELGY